MVRNHKRNHKRKGFTLIELIAVIGILAALVGVIIPLIMGIIDRAKIARAGVDMIEIGNAIVKHLDDTGIEPVVDNTACSYAGPTTLGSTTFVWNINSCASAWLGPYIDKDRAFGPWGREYYYNLATDTANLACSYETNIYSIIVTVDISNMPQSKRQRVVERLDRNLDGSQSRTSGKVRYPSDWTTICIGYASAQF